VTSFDPEAADSKNGWRLEQSVTLAPDICHQVTQCF
jgi:hypothetical protein